MTQRDDGGPAFPGKKPESVSWDSSGRKEVGYRHDPGMTLRDWFAGQALAAFIHASWDELAKPLETKQTIAADYADNCYIVADAMLAERSKLKEE